MPYIRHDIKNDPVPSTPDGGINAIGKNVTQKVSSITYEVYNQSYERSDLGPNQKQPDLRDGWNTDYIRNIHQDDGSVITTCRSI